MKNKNNKNGLLEFVRKSFICTIIHFYFANDLNLEKPAASRQWPVMRKPGSAVDICTESELCDASSLRETIDLVKASRGIEIW